MKSMDITCLLYDMEAGEKYPEDVKAIQAEAMTSWES